MLWCTGSPSPIVLMSRVSLFFLGLTLAHPLFFFSPSSIIIILHAVPSLGSYQPFSALTPFLCMSELVIAHASPFSTEAGYHPSILSALEIGLRHGMRACTWYS